MNQQAACIILISLHHTAQLCTRTSRLLASFNDHKGLGCQATAFGNLSNLSKGTTKQHNPSRQTSLFSGASHPWTLSSDSTLHASRQLCLLNTGSVQASSSSTPDGS
eukprot:1142877-Pelagomonas_calceolata.AAC.5